MNLFWLNVEFEISFYIYFKCLDKDVVDKRKLVSKWYLMIKGILRRNYRVFFKGEGNCLFKVIVFFFLDDDYFRDVIFYKVNNKYI